MKLFVYGTLKRGGRLHHVLTTSKFVTTAKLHGTMYNLGEFPAITLIGATDIHGEIYEIDDEVLALLDKIEGYPGFYDRQEIKTSRGDAMVYFHQFDQRLDDVPIIRSGNWPVDVNEEEYA